MAKVDVIMPQMGESVMEGTVIEWTKQIGDTIEVDETLLEIATDKVDSEVPSPEAGVLVEILVEEGEITKAKFSFDIASLADTNLPGNLIKHLRGADYFNVTSFPKITFYVSQVVNGVANGTLTVVGIEKEINFPISVNFNEESLNAKAEFDLDMLSFEFPHLVKTHQKSPEERKSGPSNIVHISFDISAKLLN